jgi:NTP pyrophosphatase (non-canonical NTP hydrolase)
VVPDKEHIKEEIADCLVMLWQFIEYYGITREELMLIERYKVNRQLDRIEEENEKK